MQARRPGIERASQNAKNASACHCHGNALLRYLLLRRRVHEPDQTSSRRLRRRWTSSNPARSTALARPRVRHGTGRKRLVILRRSLAAITSAERQLRYIREHATASEGTVVALTRTILGGPYPNGPGQIEDLGQQRSLT